MADIKERAEHLMLLDLGRNDVGRVSKPGTVRVRSNYDVEYYSHVMHIASQVEGEIRDDLDAVDALIAGFPAGTVSGAPKIRAMELIDELEPDRRGAYSGAIGYISVAGDLDTCIALRTAVVKDQTMYVQAGAGIVYDSDPDSEYEETRNKARALIRAAGEALRFTIKPESDKANKLGVTSILNAPNTADILDVSKLILIISHCAEGGRMQSLCHRFLVCFTIIIW